MMQRELPSDWLTGGVLDAEYKRYILLAWLKHVERDFRKVKIYPGLGNLVEQHRALQSFQTDQKHWHQKLRGSLKGLNFASRRMIYEHFTAHPELQSYLDEVLNFAIPQIEKAIANGRNLYEIVEDHLYLEPLGIQPLYRDEGYLFVYDESLKTVNNYRFSKSNIIIDDEPHVRLKTHPVERVKKSLNETFEHMKVRLTKEFPDWPNPAVFLARMSYTFPLREAALPVAKKRLMQALQN
jgi:hypothetical protein|tara:strand:- start:1452 stop:2168 length:717 start_codon:yes stop_codon:yes gene_type:complete